MKDQKPFETDNGNYILDCQFGPIADAAALEKEMKLVPGVVECGLFIAIADVLVIGSDDQVEVKEKPKPRLNVESSLPNAFSLVESVASPH